MILKFEFNGGCYNVLNKDNENIGMIAYSVSLGTYILHPDDDLAIDIRALKEIVTFIESQNQSAESYS